MKPANRIEFLLKRNIMSRTYNLTGRNKTKQRANRWNQRNRTNNEHEDTIILPWRNPIVHQIHTKPT